MADISASRPHSLHLCSTPQIITQLGHPMPPNMSPNLESQMKATGVVMILTPPLHFSRPFHTARQLLVRPGPNPPS